MMTAFPLQQFNCVTDYALETFNSFKGDRFTRFFDTLALDPYLPGSYRFRSLSHVSIADGHLIKLPQQRLFQSKDYNPVLGDVVREYPELDNELIELEDFQKAVLEFFEFCRLCSDFNEIGIHQIRITASPQHQGNPAPEGIHRDGVDLVGIFCVNRSNIAGGETHLYKTKDTSPIFTKILNPGELLVFNDRQFFHFTTPLQPTSAAIGYRDVFVFTCPGLTA
mgnify:FL=1